MVGNITVALFLICTVLLLILIVKEFKNRLYIRILYTYNA